MVSERGHTKQFESGVRIGDFEIEKRLGAGGMGIVYQARQVSLNRRVALKVLGPALTQGADMARFQREAQAVARLKHPGIATLYFVGQDAELCYHVMELVEGIPLRNVIDRLAEAQDEHSGPDTVVTAEMTGRHEAPEVRFDQPTTDNVSVAPAPDAHSLSPAAKQVRRSPQYVRRCCEIVRDAARALAYAHDQGVIHRDVKSENLMLDQRGQVHLIDFGLARFFDDMSITNTGQLVGTPLYMSPEQVTGRIKVDHRTDIYSLGLVLYELLTLRRPIDFTSRESLLRNIVAKALPPLCGRNPSLPRALEAVAHKATHKDPEERYQSAAELADELDRFLEGKPVSAPAYRYRLDARETVASRPGSVVLASFLCFLAGCAVFVALASVGVMTSVMMDSYLMLAVQSLVGLAVLAGTMGLSRGLLAGWNWARWAVVILAGLVAVACVVAGILLAVMASGSLNELPASLPDQQAGAPKGPAPISTKNMMLGIAGMYSVPVLLAFICATTTVVSLILPGTRAWFRMAGRVRLEHRQMLKSLGD